MRGGLAALAGGVGAAALAACGEAEVVEKTVTVTVTEVKEVIKEVPVEVPVTKEVEVERVVVKEVPVETIKEVPVETIKEVEVEKVVEKEVVKEVFVEKVVIEEKLVERAKELVPGINIFSYPDVIPLGPYNPTVGGEVSYPTFGNANSYHPLRAASRASVEIGNMIHEPLYVLGAGNDFAPLLAAGSEVQDDRTQWRIRLRNDVVFHNDEPFNADTVISNFEEIFDESIVRGGIVGFANELNK
ncbi:MAG: ABC transporter substrate-binding protein, partial [Chloroflexi bacterium]|nr:ABC transporter substrate-binding protein [Chloroflexota bacterium]